MIFLRNKCEQVLRDIKVKAVNNVNLTSWEWFRKVFFIYVSVGKVLQFKKSVIAPYTYRKIDGGISQSNIQIM